MNVVWLSVIWPHPLTSGGRIRTAQTLEVLASLVDRVTVVAGADAGTDPRSVAAIAPNLHVVPPRPWPTSVRRDPAALAGTAVRALLRGEPYRSAKWDPGLADLAQEHLDGADLLYVNYLGTAGAVERLSRRGVALPPVVFEAHNVEHQAVEDVIAGLGRGAAVLTPALRAEARRVRRLEQSMVQRAAATVAISAEDRGALEGLGARSAVEVPPGAWPLVPREGLGRDLLVMGNFGWTPNAQSLRRMLPSLAHLPCAGERLVVGAGASPALQRDIAEAGFRYLGFVPDLEPLWRDARVLVVPGAGTGSRMRFLEAFRRGIPTVALSESAGERAALGCDVVEDLADLREAVARVLTDDGVARRLSALGQAVAREHHSEHAVREAMARVLAAASGAEGEHGERGGGGDLGDRAEHVAGQAAHAPHRVKA